MIGDWSDHWEQLQALQQRLEDIGAGRIGGSVDARVDLGAFFERSESLRDWVKRAIGDTHKPSKIVDPAMKASMPLSLAHDIAIKIKHEIQSEPPWSGAMDADIVSQSVVVTPQTLHMQASVPSSEQPARPPPVESPTTASHQWNVRYTSPSSNAVILDSLQLSRDVVAEWQRLLSTFGLV